MANVIKHKRGSGSDPSASDLVVGEVAIRTDVGKLFTKMDNGSVAEIAGGGSDIAINTLSSSSATGGGSATFNGSAYRFTLSAPPSVSAQQLLVSINGVIQKPVAGTGQPSEGFSVDGTDIILGDAPATGSDFFILTFKSLGVSEPADNSVTSAKIADGAIVNADINASAAIARTKLANVDLVDDTSPQLGGALDTNGNAISFGDSSGNGVNRLTFGALTHGDLEIYHDGNNSYIQERGTGYLHIRGSDSVRIQDTDTAENMAVFNKNGAVELYHDNSKKFETTSSGVAATGDVQLTNFLKATGDLLLCADIDNDNSGTALRFCVDGDQSAEKMRIDSSGNVGIGTTSPNRHLHLHESDSTGASVRFTNSTTGSGENDGLTVGINGNEQAEFWQRENTAMVFGTNNTQRMAISASGHVGIGSTSPSYRLSVEAASGTDVTALFKSDDANAWIQIRDNTTTDTGVMVGANGDNLLLRAGSNERMRIDSSGNKFMDENFTTTDINARKSYFNSTGQQFHARGAHEAMIVFQKPDGTQIGSIARTVSNIAYNTSSDYRLKENICGILDGITRLKQLKPSRFNFISDPDITIDGFIAHEVSSIVPEAVTGEKDEVDSDNKPVYQGIDHSKLVPLLVAAVQELTAKVEALEAK